MNESDLVSAWNASLLMFSAAFSDPVSRTFVNLMTGWVLATGRRTISGIIPFADPKGDRSHDTYCYFFSDARWKASALWETWTKCVVEAFAAEGPVPIDLDDTLFHKTGRKVNGAAWWRDAVRSTGTRTVHALGLNLVLLTIRVKPPWGGEPIGIPVNMRLHRKDGETLLDLAESMVRELAVWLPEREFSLCADGFYASLAGRKLPRTVVTSRIRRDAEIYDLLRKPRKSRKPRKKPRGRPRKRGQRLPNPETMARRARKWVRVEVEERGRKRERLLYVREVLWYEVCGSTPVLLVISRDPTGKEKDDYFFTTDVTRRPGAVVEGVAGRWSIEDTFRNTKQFLGAEEPQVWKGPGPERVAAASFLLYGLVWVWYLGEGCRQSQPNRSPWYPSKERPSFQDALYALRKALWEKRLFALCEPGFVPPKIVSSLIHAVAASA